MTTIDKIKAEIERQKEINKRLLDGQLREGCLYAYNQVLSFLSTLESEKPMREELEEEIKRYGKEEMPVVLESDLNDIARHFAQWGAERQKEQDDRFVDIIYHQGIEKGKDDMKEQMMQEAVEGEITKDNRGNNVLRVGLFNIGFEYGDKVRIIIVKEDEK